MKTTKLFTAFAVAFFLSAVTMAPVNNASADDAKPKQEKVNNGAAQDTQPKQDKEEPECD